MPARDDGPQLHGNDPASAADQEAENVQRSLGRKPRNFEGLGIPSIGDWFGEYVPPSVYVIDSCPPDDERTTVMLYTNLKEGDRFRFRNGDYHERTVMVKVSDEFYRYSSGGIHGPCFRVMDLDEGKFESVYKIDAR